MSALASTACLARSLPTDEPIDLTADFTGTPVERVTWDFDCALDLSKAPGVEFDIWCEDVEQFSSIFIYFKSGDGWYVNQFSPDESGAWEHIRIGRGGWTEGSPGGWDNISLIRLSGWREGSRKTICRLAHFAVQGEEPIPTPHAIRQEMRARVSEIPSVSPEFRAFWCQQPRGLDADHDWDASVRFLSENGFNALLANLASASTAYYASKVLPVDASVQKEGDALKDCLAACRKYGVQCHVWKVSWNMGWRVSGEVLERLKAEKRIQVSFDGRAEERWLCPSDERNQAQEVESMVELAARGVDGVHFDYIRYPGEDFCFCDRCRVAFEKKIGFGIVHWPADVRSNPDLVRKWQDFRVANISRVVQKVSQRLRADYPAVCISAAVFHQPDGVDYRQIGQDWPTWCKNGWLDFVCPMDYDESARIVGRRARMQRSYAGGCPLRPGLGLSCWHRDDVMGLRLSRQIDAVRAAGCDGFVVFNLDETALGALPDVHRGPTSKPATVACASKRIQSLIDAHVGGVTIIPPGKYEIDSTIWLPSHTHLCLDGCHLRMKNGSFAPMFRNRTDQKGDSTDIVIDGKGTAVLDGGEPNGLDEYSSGKDGYPCITENLTFCLTGLQDFQIKGLKIRDQRWWAFMLLECERGRIGEIDFSLTRHALDTRRRWRNQDGIDLRIGCHDIEIENITGETGDDMIALTALQWTADKNLSRPGKSREISDIKIRHVRGRTSMCSLVRILSHFGQRIHDVRIEDVVESSVPGKQGQSQMAIRIGDRVPAYYHTPANAQRYGDISDIVIDGLETRALAAVVTDDSVRNLTVRNVRLFGDARSVWCCGYYNLIGSPFIYVTEREDELHAMSLLPGKVGSGGRDDVVRVDNVLFDGIRIDSDVPCGGEALFRFNNSHCTNCRIKGVEGRVSGRRRISLMKTDSGPKLVE